MGGTGRGGGEAKGGDRKHTQQESPPQGAISDRSVTGIPVPAAFTHPSSPRSVREGRHKKAKSQELEQPVGEDAEKVQAPLLHDAQEKTLQLSDSAKSACSRIQLSGASPGGKPDLVLQSMLFTQESEMGTFRQKLGSHLALHLCLVVTELPSLPSRIVRWVPSCHTGPGAGTAGGRRVRSQFLSRGQSAFCPCPSPRQLEPYSSDAGEGALRTLVLEAQQP